MSTGVGPAPATRAVALRVPGSAGFVRPRHDGAVVVLEHGSWSVPFAADALERVEAGTTVVTSAVPEVDWPVLERAGFRQREILLLLELPLARLRDEVSPRGVRRGRRRDLVGALEADVAAFAGGAALDSTGLAEARHATNRNRFAVVDTPGGGIAGYAISGVAARTGYLQRLAVHPQAQHRGHGTALVADTICWLRRRNANIVLVNTHPTNTRALALYERFGFTPRTARLAVFEATGRGH